MPSDAKGVVTPVLNGTKYVIGVWETGRGRADEMSGQPLRLTSCPVGAGRDRAALSTMRSLGPLEQIRRAVSTLTTSRRFWPEGGYSTTRPSGRKA
ncbi:hypothetical protein AAHC03_017075 [Spirometra sp. Aus1]